MKIEAIRIIFNQLTINNKTQATAHIAKKTNH